MENKDMARIANPIYDVVFRYLMEDNKIAKLFLSAIIGKEIEELVFNPTTHSSKFGDGGSITVIRMDFSARIRDEFGKEELVLIELQKAKFYFQTMRFRKYLGRQYQNQENIDQKEQPIPLLPIYILGEAFTKTVTPVIKIRRHYLDSATEETISERHPFIEALTHDAIIIQIPYLKNHRRTILEKFLVIFDQSLKDDDNGHILALNAEGYPKRYQPVIRRLIKALQNPKIEADMELEDEVVNEFNRQSMLIAKAEQKAEEAEQKAEEAEQKAEEAEYKANSERTAKIQLIRNLSKAGMSISEIAKLAEMTEEEIRSILETK